MVTLVTIFPLAFTSIVLGFNALPEAFIFNIGTGAPVPVYGLRLV